MALCSVSSTRVVRMAWHGISGAWECPGEQSAGKVSDWSPRSWGHQIFRYSRDGS